MSASWHISQRAAIGHRTLAMCMQTGQNFWLSYWSEKTLTYQKQVAADPIPPPPFPTSFYMTVYFSIGIFTMCVQACRAVLLVISTLRASQARLSNYA